MCTHQLGQSDFRVALAEDTDWEPFPSFPLRPDSLLLCERSFGAGSVRGPGDGANRHQIDSHQGHHEDRVYDRSFPGVFCNRRGDRHFDEEKLVAYPSGAVTFCLAHTLIPLG